MGRSLISPMIDRTLVLVFARITNPLVLIATPIVLTRILDVEQFGLYREFILYAMVFVGLCRFGIDRSLIYLVPKHPGKEWVFVSQCVLFAFITFIVGLVIFGIVTVGFPVAEGFNYKTELLLYAFFLMHMDMLESYWLGKKDSVRVLIYGSVRVILRVTTVVGIAVYSDDVHAIFVGLVVIEGARWLFVLGYLLHGRLLGWRLSFATLNEQWQFFAPLGSATVLQTLNKYLGQIVTVGLLGPSALALYVLGAYVEMISHVVRGSIADVIFPDMVEAESTGKNRALALWQRGSVVYAFILVPVGLSLFLHAESLVTLLFSAAYAGAAPVFMVFSLILLRDCINFGSPLRALNRTRVVLEGTAVSLIVTALATVPLVWQFGLVGPAIAFLIGRTTEEIYMGRRLIGITGVSLRDVLPWGNLLRLLVAAVVAVGLGEAVTSWMATGPEHALIAITVAACIYLIIVHYLRIPEIDRVIERVTAAVKARIERSAT